LPGGDTDVQSLGWFEELIEWEGALMYEDAPARVQELDAMRIAGKPVKLTCGFITKTVVIRWFAFEYCNDYFITYSLALQSLDNATFNGSEVTGQLQPFLKSAAAEPEKFAAENSVTAYFTDSGVLLTGNNSVNSAYTPVRLYLNSLSPDGNLEMNYTDGVIYLLGAPLTALPPSKIYFYNNTVYAAKSDINNSITMPDSGFVDVCNYFIGTYGLIESDVVYDAGAKRFCVCGAVLPTDQLINIGGRYYTTAALIDDAITNIGNLNPGDAGGAALLLQRILNFAGIDTGGFTGVYNAQTEAAVLAIQYSFMDRVYGRQGILRRMEANRKLCTAGKRRRQQDIRYDKKFN